jgi:hypothetical protein
VAEELSVDDALGAVGVVPSQPIPLLVDSAGVFPPSTALFLACVVTEALVTEQHRVHAAVSPLADRPWPHFERDRWIPHITVSWSLTPGELAVAVPLVLERLPIAGTFDRGGIEDGTTGEYWPAPSPS